MRRAEYTAESSAANSNSDWSIQLLALLQLRTVLPALARAYYVTQKECNQMQYAERWWMMIVL